MELYYYLQVYNRFPCLLKLLAIAIKGVPKYWAKLSIKVHGKLNYLLKNILSQNNNVWRAIEMVCEMLSQFVIWCVTVNVSLLIWFTNHKDQFCSPWDVLPPGRIIDGLKINHNTIILGGVVSFDRWLTFVMIFQYAILALAMMTLFNNGYIGKYMAKFWNNIDYRKIHI